MSTEEEGDTTTELAHRLSDAISRLRAYGPPTNPCIVETVEALALIQRDMAQGRRCSEISGKIDQAKECLDQLLIGYRP